MSREISFAKRLKYRLLGAVTNLLFGAMRALGVERASNLGAWLAGTLGPLFPVSRIGRVNLQLAFPEMPEAERERLLRRVWRNLGRVGAEYAHLDTITDRSTGRVELEGVEFMTALRDAGQPMIFFSGHISHWEVMHIMASRYGLDVATIVRPPNNPYLAQRVEELRGVAGGLRLDKGSEGARKALAHLKQGGALGILIDQRLGKGEMVDFFGHPAETPSAMAQVALRYKIPLLPAALERLGPGRFRLKIYPPLDLPSEGKPQERVVALTQAMTRFLEDRIRERPEEWLWLHRRWPREHYRKG